jgi:hypothetical protein
MNSSELKLAGRGLSFDAHRSVLGEAGHKGSAGALCLPNAGRRHKPSG